MSEPTVDSRVRVVVLGAGYAGLTCFLELQDRLARGHDLVLVSRDRHHWFTTELHTYAAGHDADAVRIPLRRLVRPPGRLIIDHVSALRPAARQVELKLSGTLAYDLLVFALGSEPEYFGLPGIPRHALTIGSPPAAREVRERVRALAAREGPPGHVLVVGGGLTGVELAAELADEYPGRLRVTILEAAPEIMAGFPPDLVQVARRILEGKGIRILAGSPIVTADASCVHLQGGGEVPYDLLVWAGGVRGHSLLARAGLALGGRGRARVDAFLRSVIDDRIYVIGDSAAFADPASGREIPPTGQAAVQMGRAAAENILRRLGGRPERPFAFRMRGQFASLGHHEGVGVLGEAPMAGLPAMAVKHFVEGLHAWEVGGGVMPLVRRLVAAPVGYLRGRRLRTFTRQPRPVSEQPP
ncbi:NAD(P)/FAD-dependent oxidoreductase [Symbiobacterium thermophilum]|uniref:NAD(P)/FAD-dependent oxidoreductase n=1 Tax=Symbiobacterium thermophilum TaxID=2734 RepID=UPI0002EB1779|nr:NAD(P)/FAD-dependent oxidoreductase [Symbiobacterium thermophilum]